MIKKGLPFIDLEGKKRIFDGNDDENPIIDMGVYEHDSVDVRPGLACLVYPAGKISDLRPEFIWTGVDKSAAYKLRVKQGAEIVLFSRRFRDSDINSNGICYVRSSVKLDQDDKYFWQVKAVNKDGRGKWSRKKRFEIK